MELWKNQEPDQSCLGIKSKIKDVYKRQTLDSGIVTVNTEIAEKVGIDYSIFKDMCSELIETVTAEEFN